MSVRLQVRRDSSANWTSNNPTLAEGEIGYETDTGKLKIGSGASWTSTQYFPSSLEFIGDVDIMTPSDNDVLTWDSATSKWSSQASAGGATLAGEMIGNISGASYTYGIKDLDFISSQNMSGQLLALHKSRDISGWDSTEFTNSGLMWNGSAWIAMPSGGSGGGGVLSVIDINADKDWNSKGIYNMAFLSSQTISSNTISSYYNTIISGLLFNDNNVRIFRYDPNDDLVLEASDDIMLYPTDNVVIGCRRGQTGISDDAQYATFDGDAGRFYIAEGGGGTKLPSYTMHISGNLWAKTISSQGNLKANLISSTTGIYVDWLSGNASNLAGGTGYWDKTGDDIYYADGEVRIGHSGFDCGSERFQVSGDSFFSGNVTFIGEISGIADPTYASGVANKHYVDSNTSQLAGVMVGNISGSSYSYGLHDMDFVSSQTISGQLLALHNARDISGWDSATFTNSGLVWNGSAWEAMPSGGSGGGLSNIVEDTSPQLGGDLDGQDSYGINDVEYISSQKIYTSGVRFGGVSMRIADEGNDLIIVSPDNIELHTTGDVLYKDENDINYAKFDGDTYRFVIDEYNSGIFEPLYTMHVSGNIHAMSISSQYNLKANLISSATGINVDWISGNSTNLAGAITAADFKASTGTWTFVSSQTISGGSITTGDYTINANTISGAQVFYMPPTTDEPANNAGAVWMSGNTTYARLYMCTSNSGSWRQFSFA